MDVSEHKDDDGPSRSLVRLLSMGGKITKAPYRISIMLNGLRYYSLELILEENYYNIQGYELDAIKLHKTTMLILSDIKHGT
jgi:hypothetical protein